MQGKQVATSKEVVGDPEVASAIIDDERLTKPAFQIRDITNISI